MRLALIPRTAYAALQGDFETAALGAYDLLTGNLTMTDKDYKPDFELTFEDILATFDADDRAGLLGWPNQTPTWEDVIVERGDLEFALVVYERSERIADYMSLVHAKFKDAAEIDRQRRFLRKVHDTNKSWLEQVRDLTENGESIFTNMAAVAERVAGSQFANVFEQLPDGVKAFLLGTMVSQSAAPASSGGMVYSVSEKFLPQWAQTAIGRVGAPLAGWLSVELTKLGARGIYTLGYHAGAMYVAPVVGGVTLYGLAHSYLTPKPPPRLIGAYEPWVNEPLLAMYKDIGGALTVVEEPDYEDEMAPELLGYD